MMYTYRTNVIFFSSSSCIIRTTYSSEYLLLLLFFSEKFFFAQRLCNVVVVVVQKKYTRSYWLLRRSSRAVLPPLQQSPAAAAGRGEEGLYYVRVSRAPTPSSKPTNSAKKSFSSSSHSFDLCNKRPYTIYNAFSLFLPEKNITRVIIFSRGINTLGRSERKGAISHL